MPEGYPYCSAWLEAKCTTSYKTYCHPKDKSFDELVEMLNGHFKLKPLVIAGCFHFYKRNQAAGESVAQFIAELRRLARHCKFKTFLIKALRDRSMCRLSSKAIQNCLLNKKELGLQKATDMEAAAKKSHRAASYCNCRGCIGRWDGKERAHGHS